MGRGSQLDQSVHAAGARLMLEDVTLKFGWCYTRGLAKSWPEHAKRRCKESCKRAGKRLPHGKLGPRGIYRERRRSSGSVIGIPIPSERRRGFAFELLAAKQPAQFDGSVLGFPLAETPSGKHMRVCVQENLHLDGMMSKADSKKHSYSHAEDVFELGSFRIKFLVSRSHPPKQILTPKWGPDFDPKMGSIFGSRMGPLLLAKITAVGM